MMSLNYLQPSQTSREKMNSLPTIIDRADQALYVAKWAGKNRVASEKELLPTREMNSV